MYLKNYFQDGMSHIGNIIIIFFDALSLLFIPVVFCINKSAKASSVEKRPWWSNMFIERPETTYWVFVFVFFIIGTVIFCSFIVSYKEESALLMLPMSPDALSVPPSTQPPNLP
jgi:hypothetical protein